MEIYMVTGTCLMFAAIMYFIGRLDGAEQYKDMYIHEQTSRAIAEAQCVRLTNELMLRDDKIIEQQKLLNFYEAVCREPA